MITLNTFMKIHKMCYTSKWYGIWLHFANYPSTCKIGTNSICTMETAHFVDIEIFEFCMLSYTKKEKKYFQFDASMLRWPTCNQHGIWNVLKHKVRESITNALTVTLLPGGPGGPGGPTSPSSPSAPSNPERP